MSTNNLIQFISPDEAPKVRWIILSHDKKTVLADPTTGLPYCTDNEIQAKVIAKEISEEDGVPVSPCELHLGLRLLAKHRYGLNIVASNNPEEQAANVLKAILTQTKPS